MQPQISIIIPVYNVEDYVEKCLQSVAGQSYRHLEIIAVDDGSSDRSGGICDAYAKQDGRIRVIHQPNRGLSAARNRGLQSATSDFIAFVDSDDYLHLRMYETLMHYLTCYDADIVECDYAKVCREEEEQPYRVAQVLVASGTEAVRSLLQWGPFDISVWNKLYQRKTINGLLFPEGKIHEDDFWTYKAYFNAAKIVHVKFPFYSYRQRLDSILGQAMSLKNLAVVEAYRERAEFINRCLPELKDVAERRLVFIIIYKMHDVIVRNNRQRDQQKTLCKAFYQEFGRLDPRVVRRHLRIKSREWWALKLMLLYPGVYRFFYHLYCKLLKGVKWYCKEFD